MESLETIVSWMEDLDNETHVWGKDTTSSCRGKEYDVDYITNRTLSGAEAQRLMDALKTYDDLFVYSCPLEIPALREEFTTGYKIFFGLHSAGETLECERLLTVGRPQLPADITEFLHEFTYSAENKRRAKYFGRKDVSCFAGGSI